MRVLLSVRTEFRTLQIDNKYYIPFGWAVSRGFYKKTGEKIDFLRLGFLYWRTAGEDYEDHRRGVLPDGYSAHIASQVG